MLTTEPPSLVDLLEVTAREGNLTPNFSSPYLDHLVSLPLHTLLKEPALIATEASTVESELTNLCFREHSTFISIHKCSSAVRSAFDDFEGSLRRLLDSVPALDDECRAFGKGTQGIQTVRGKAALVQEHQDKLLDLLELPQLLETCVRNGYYQEAMELAAHAEDLKERYPLALVADVAKEVEGVIQLMLAQLLALLREPVKLPALIKAVTYLRRLGAMNEEELGLAFLASRLHNFRTQLVQIERDKAESVRYLRKYIDLFREHVYDIISQHTTIFADSASLTSFASLCVTDLAQLVQAYVPMVADPASMSSVLVQLGYCALSFARVGLDFSALIGQPFEEAVRVSYAQSVATAASALGTTLRNAARSAASPLDVLVSPEHRAAVLNNTDDIAHFPPLAVFTNAHLSALNALRLLAPVHLFPGLVAIQSSSMVACNIAILQYVQQAVTLPEVNGDGPSHKRTPSSPRAHLLRRNTETQLAPEIRTARRREAQRVCVGFVKAWRSTVDLVTESLVKGVYERDVGYGEDLKERLSELARWVQQNEPREPNGVIGQVPEGTKPEPTALGANGYLTNHSEAPPTTPSPRTKLGSPPELGTTDIVPQPSHALIDSDENARGLSSYEAHSRDQSTASDIPPDSPSPAPQNDLASAPTPRPRIQIPNEAPPSAVDKMFAATSLDVTYEIHQAPPLPSEIAAQSTAELQAELDAMDAGLAEERAASQAALTSASAQVDELTDVQGGETHPGIGSGLSGAIGREAGEVATVKGEAVANGAVTSDNLEATEIVAAVKAGDAEKVREVKAAIGNSIEGVQEGAAELRGAEENGEDEDDVDETEESVKEPGEAAIGAKGDPGEVDGEGGGRAQSDTPALFSPPQADPTQPKSKRRKKKGKR